MIIKKDYGSDILAVGEAREICQEKPGTKVAFGDPEILSPGNQGKMKLYWSEIFENNPNILQPGENAEEVIVISNYPKSRPYINYRKSKYSQLGEHKGLMYKVEYNADYIATRGELFFTNKEMLAGQETLKELEAPLVILNSTTTITNKNWIKERWEDLVTKAPYNFIQLGLKDQNPVIDGIKQIEFESFREACAFLKAAASQAVLLGVDGDLHHVAAALNMPSIVLWSHYSHPDNLGYVEHINIRWDAAGKPCGLRDSCIQCKKSMEMIKVQDVLLAIRMVFDKYNLNVSLT